MSGMMPGTVNAMTTAPRAEIVISAPMRLKRSNKSLCTSCWCRYDQPQPFRRERTMPTQKEIREEITTRIVTALESGVSPWRRPWRMSKNSGRPANVVSKNPYNGVNPLLLTIAAMQHGFNSKWWATYQQWATLGCQVNKRPANVETGHWGTGIVFCKPVTKTVTDKATATRKRTSSSCCELTGCSTPIR